VHALLQSAPEHSPAENAWPAIVESLTRSGSWQGELVQTSRTGKQLIVQSRHILVKDEAGQQSAILQINRDITAQREAELQSEKRLQLLSAASDFGFWYKDVPEARQATPGDIQPYLPYPWNGKLKFEEFLAVVHPDDLEGLLQKFESLDAKNKTFFHEYRLIHPEHGVRWYLGSGYVVCDEQENALHQMGTIFDITHVKQIEEDLKAANAHITTILESISGIFFFLDTDWRYVYVNQETCRIAGKAPEELLGKSIYDVYPEILGTDINRNHRLAMATQQPIDFETFSAGHWFSVHLSSTSTGLSVHGHDITKRKLMEQAVQASEAKLRRLVDANIWPIVVTDHDTAQVLEANDAYLELIGYTREDLQAGRINWRKLTPPEYQEDDDQAVKEFVEMGIYRRTEKEYIHKSGKRVPVSVVATMLENSRETIGFVTDLTPQKELEKQRTQFLGMVSRELRGPLTGIRASLQLVQRRYRRRDARLGAGSAGPGRR